MKALLHRQRGAERNVYGSVPNRLGVDIHSIELLSASKEQRSCPSLSSRTFLRKCISLVIISAVFASLILSHFYFARRATSEGRMYTDVHGTIASTQLNVRSRGGSPSWVSLLRQQAPVPAPPPASPEGSAPVPAIPLPAPARPVPAPAMPSPAPPASHSDNALQQQGKARQHLPVERMVTDTTTFVSVGSNTNVSSVSNRTTKRVDWKSEPASGASTATEEEEGEEDEDDRDVAFLDKTTHDSFRVFDQWYRAD